MSANVSPPGKYPGVYVRTITDAVPPTGGAGTSVGAFIGRLAQGPVNVPVTCLSFADFERNFGGLASDSAVSYQASGFFNNGGNQAEVVRLYRLQPANITATVTASGPGLYTLMLASLGSGPSVEVSTSFASGTPTSAEICTALALELETEPALAGHVTASVSGNNLLLSLSYPSTLSGGGPVPNIWSFAPTSGGTSAASISTGNGSAVVAFTSGVSFTLNPLAAKQSAIVTFSPPGGAPFQVTVTAPQAGWQGTDVALALFKAIRQSSAARALVSFTDAPNSAVLQMAYRAPVSVTLLEASVSVPGQITSPSSGFQLSAANPGEWGNNIVVAVDTAGINPAVATKYGLATGDLFNLTVLCGGRTERFTAVTLVQKAGANRLDRVLQNGSSLVTLSDSALLGTPAPPGGCWGQAQGGQPSAPLVPIDYLGDPNLKTGLYAFTQKPYAFNILSIPPDDTTDPLGGDTDLSVYQQASQICADNNAMLIIDPPMAWSTQLAQGGVEGISLADLGSYTDAQARACAVYFPRVIIADPLRNGLPKTVGPSGYVAAVWASVDAASGVWKAPAGLDAPIGGILQLQAKLNDDQNGVLNPIGINALRFFTGAGSVVWGARTLRGADQLGDPYKYIPVQRLLDYIETSLLQNTRWAVFQPNGQALWASLQTQITVFMNGLFAQGAFAGTSASQAFFVKCDATTTTPTDAAAGIVNVQVGFAPLYPAEFVVITISQLTASSG